MKHTCIYIYHISEEILWFKQVYYSVILYIQVSILINNTFKIINILI